MGAGTNVSRVLVTGGRDYADRDRVFAVLDALSPITVIQGGARGADRLARWWANAHANSEEYPADWALHGKAAGAIRNQQMLNECKPDLVVAFPGGRGTADMVRRARLAGVRVLEVQQ